MSISPGISPTRWKCPYDSSLNPSILRSGPLGLGHWVLFRYIYQRPIVRVKSCFFLMSSIVSLCQGKQSTPCRNTILPFSHYKTSVYPDVKWNSQKSKHLKPFRVPKRLRTNISSLLSFEKLKLHTPLLGPCIIYAWYCRQTIMIFLGIYINSVDSFLYYAQPFMFTRLKPPNYSSCDLEPSSTTTFLCRGVEVSRALLWESSESPRLRPNEKSFLVIL